MTISVKSLVREYAERRARLQQEGEARRLDMERQNAIAKSLASTVSPSVPLRLFHIDGTKFLLVGYRQDRPQQPWLDIAEAEGMP